MKEEKLEELKTRPFWRKTELLITQAKVSFDAFLERDDYRVARNFCGGLFLRIGNFLFCGN